jgi:GT2 family glycosyltransferase
MKLLVVILNYRTPGLTVACLRALRAEVVATPGCRVAVIDNGSGGDDLGQIRRAVAEGGWEGWVEVTASPENLGFTGGNNAVIRAALASADPPELFLLLNSDTVVEPGALGALVSFMDGRPRAGIAGSALLATDGTLQASPFRFQGIASELDRGLQLGLVSRALRRWAVVMPPQPRACAVDWVSGASMVLRRSMLEAVGLLDEGLFTYFDDVDLCLRARRAGWEVWYVPESRVVHLEGASSGITEAAPRRRPAYWFQARRRFFLKSHGPAYTALADAAFLSGCLLHRVRRRLQGKPDTDPPHFLADAARHSVFGAGFALTAVRPPGRPPA